MTDSTLANEFATDTMSLVLRIERRRLGPTVRAIFDAAEAGHVTVYVPAMVFAEILYLSEKRKIDMSLSDVAEHLTQHPKYQAYPMNFAVVQTAAQITDIRELHDRLIAATARLLDRALITNDPIIQASAFVQTVWEGQSTKNCCLTDNYGRQKLRIIVKYSATMPVEWQGHSVHDFPFASLGLRPLPLDRIGLSHRQAGRVAVTLHPDD